MVEILEYNEDLSDSNCAQFYWEDNAECNDAEGQNNSVHLTSREISAEVDMCTAIPASDNKIAPSCWLISGVQHVSKFKERARNLLAVHIAIVRLPHVGTDLVLHYNQPLELSAASSSAAVARPADAAGAHDAAVRLGAGAMEAMVRSLRVHDWGLFAAPDEDGGSEQGGAS